MNKKSRVDELRAEYDLTSLRVVKRGPGREPNLKLIVLEDDVAAVFPTSDAVNEALRTLIRSQNLG